MKFICYKLHHRRLCWPLALSVLWNMGAFLSAGEPLPKGSLSGTIVDPNGKPVSGARVWVNTWGKKLLAEARSDAQGRFRLGPVDPVYRHPWPIFIEADGFAPQCIWGESYSIFPGADCDLGKIRADRGRVFTGQVLDVDGRPRRNAEVTYYVSGRRNDRIGPEQHLATDSEGRFRTPPLPVGELYLWVTAPERRLASLARFVQPGGEEALEPIRLERDVPIQGIVRDERGRPVAGAEIHTYYECGTTISDSNGRFTLHGLGPSPRFQFKLRKEGYVFVNRGVSVHDDGIHWHEVGDDTGKDHGPFRELSVVLTPQAWIEGQARDADTGEPVRLDRVVLCFFERKANGEVVLSGCRSPDFEQPEAGRFRVPYSVPDEYHLTCSAAGYHDAEAFTPKVTELKPIEGIVVKLRKKREGSASEVPKQTISGSVTRDGKPVATGWVGLWKIGRACTVGWGWRMRGRTTVPDPSFIASAPIRDGAYSLNVPYQDDAWYVAVEEPGQPLTQVGPIKIAVNEKRPLDIACTAGGNIRGRVKNVPAGWEDHLWAVAFTKTGIQVETRVNRDGEFRFQQLPPGEYGLKVGHDAYRDSELGPKERAVTKEEWNREIDPWQRAKMATVEAGHETNLVELEFPQ